MTSDERSCEFDETTLESGGIRCTVALAINCTVLLSPLRPIALSDSLCALFCSLLLAQSLAAMPKGDGSNKH